MGITASMEGCTLSLVKLGADPGWGHGGASECIGGGAGKESETNGIALWKRYMIKVHSFNEVGSANKRVSSSNGTYQAQGGAWFPFHL